MPDRPSEGPIPDDIRRAMDSLSQYNPALAEQVFKELQKRVAAATDPSVQIKQEERRMAKDKQDLVKSILAYSLILLLAVIFGLLSYAMVLRDHSVEAASVMAGFGAIILAILNPFNRGNALRRNDDPAKK